MFIIHALHHSSETRIKYQNVNEQTLSQFWETTNKHYSFTTEEIKKR